MVRLGLSLAALVVTALSLGPSFAHVLEAPPRLTTWSPELWREATVFNGQFYLFGVLGGPLDIGAILVTGGLAFSMRGQPSSYGIALVGTLLFIASLIVWLTWVAPANSVLATWTPGPVPGNFHEIRNRWETGHMVIAGVKLAGFIAVALSILVFPAPGQRAQ